MRPLSVVIAVLASVLSCGCDAMRLNPRPQEPAPVPASPAQTSAPYMAQASQTARPEPTAQSQSAVEAALDWARKYAQAQGRVSTLEQENHALAQRVQATDLELEATRKKLSAAERELNEANTLMKELDTRLVKWQESVLGYRQEMRDAQKVQMDALVKVIRLLGGDVPANQTGGKDKVSGHEEQ